MTNLDSIFKSRDITFPTKVKALGDSETLGDSERQGNLAYCSPWGCRVRQDLATEQLQITHDIEHLFTYSQSYGFSSGHVQMWELDHKEGQAPKNWCFLILVLEKILESPLGSKEIKPVNPKGNQSWIFIGRTDAEAPILWPPDVKSWLIVKDPDVGKDWGQEETRVTEHEMVG